MLTPSKCFLKIYKGAWPFLPYRLRLKFEAIVPEKRHVYRIEGNSNIQEELKRNDGEHLMSILS